jgi:hypothetical protein
MQAKKLCSWNTTANYSGISHSCTIWKMSIFCLWGILLKMVDVVSNYYINLERTTVLMDIRIWIVEFRNTETLIFNPFLCKIYQSTVSNSLKRWGLEVSDWCSSDSRDSVRLPFTGSYVSRHLLVTRNSLLLWTPKFHHRHESGSNQFTQFPYVLITYVSTSPLCPQVASFLQSPFPKYYSISD